MASQLTETIRVIGTHKNAFNPIKTNQLFKHGYCIRCKNLKLQFP